MKILDQQELILIAERHDVTGFANHNVENVVAHIMSHFGAVYKTKKTVKFITELCTWYIALPSSVYQALTHLYITGKIRDIKPTTIDRSNIDTVRQSVRDILPTQTSYIHELTYEGQITYGTLLMDVAKVNEWVLDDNPHDGIHYELFHTIHHMDARSEFVELFADEIARELIVIDDSGNDQIGSLCGTDIRRYSFINVLNMYDHISELNTGGELHFLKAKCPTGKIVLTAVPNTITTIIEAQQWVAGIDDDDSVPPLPLMRT